MWYVKNYLFPSVVLKKIYQVWYINIPLFVGVIFWRLKYIRCNGPKGRPNNLPQPSWCLPELFFWSDLSWSRADLCSNSYVISTHFCLLSTMPLCTRYISNIGIGRIIHNVLFRISMHGLFVTLDPTDFQVTCDCSFFSRFE